jgi:hypothetical protein
VAEVGTSNQDRTISLKAAVRSCKIIIIIIIMGTVSLLFSFCGWLGDQGTVVQLLLEATGFSSSPKHQDQLWGPHILPHNRYCVRSFSRRGQCKS